MAVEQCSVLNLENARKRRILQTKREKTKVYLLDANEEWHMEKAKWVNVNLGIKNKYLRVFAKAQTVRLDKDGAPAAVDIFAKLAKRKAKEPKLWQNINSIPKINSYFAQHLLELHERYCMECYSNEGVVGHESTATKSTGVIEHKSNSTAANSTGVIEHEQKSTTGSSPELFSFRGNILDDSFVEGILPQEGDEEQDSLDVPVPFVDSNQLPLLSTPKKRGMVCDFSPSSYIEMVTPKRKRLMTNTSEDATSCFDSLKDNCQIHNDDGKRCVYSLCPNSAENCDKDVFFLTFPRPKKDLQKCKRWVAACGRYDSDLLKRLEKCTLFICSLHFVGERGPTDDNPDPVPFRETTDTLKLMGIRFHTNLDYTSDVAIQGNNFTESPADNTNTNLCQTQSVIKEEISIISRPLTFYASNSDGNSITESPDNLSLSSKEQVIKEEIFPTNTFQDEILETNSKGTQTQGQEIFTQHDYDSLKVAITSSLIILPNEWSFTITNRNVVLFKSNLRTSAIIISLTVSEESLIPVLRIYGQSLPENHPLLKLLPEFTQVEAIHSAINIFKNWLLCDGIRDVKFKTQFEERDFNKIDGHVSFFTNNLHSKTCDVILRKILRKKSLCLKCSQFKRRLDQQIRKKQQSKDNKERRNCYLSHADLQLELIEMKRKSENLTKQVKRLLNNSTYKVLELSAT